MYFYSFTPPTKGNCCLAMEIAEGVIRYFFNIFFAYNLYENLLFWNWL